MTVATGANAVMLIAKESEYGVTPAISEFKKVVFKSCSLDGSQDLIENDDLGMGREPLAPVKGRTSVSGDVKIPVDLENMGLWLTGLLGNPVSTDNTGSFTHVFSSGKSELPSFTIEKGLTEVSDYSIFNGCKVNSMAFDYQSSGTSSATVVLIGQGETNNDATIQSSPTQFNYTPFANAQGFADIDGSDVEIMSASLSLTNNMVGVETIRSDNKISGIDAGMFNATGSVVVRFEDKSLLNKAIAGTPVAIILGFKISDTQMLKIKLLEAYISKPGKSIDGPGGIELSFDFQSAKNNAAGKAVEVELINNVNSY